MDRSLIPWTQDTLRGDIQIYTSFSPGTAAATQEFKHTTTLRNGLEDWAGLAHEHAAQKSAGLSHAVEGWLEATVLLSPERNPHLNAHKHIQSSTICNCTAHGRTAGHNEYLNGSNMHLREYGLSPVRSAHWKLSLRWLVWRAYSTWPWLSMRAAT